jgi:putative DNA primase/helicase
MDENRTEENERLVIPEPKCFGPDLSYERVAPLGKCKPTADWPISGLETGVELLEESARVFMRYVAVPREVADAIALFVAGAHAHDVAVTSPILALLSPEPRCGKTTALRIIGELVPRPMSTSNVSEAALYRMIEEDKPTLLVDEVDTFLAHRKTLIGILNAGQTRTAAFVVRAAPKDGGIVKSSVWCPKVVAGIGKLPPSLYDRSILIPLKRRRHDETIERLGLNVPTELIDLHARLAGWIESNLDALANADPVLPEALNDRAADNWRLLVAIADLAGGDWPDRARAAAVKLSASSAGTTETDAVMLLSDIRQIFAEIGGDRLKSADIASRLGEMEERPWPEWRHGRPITPAQIAAMLNRYEIKPNTQRFGQETAKAYLLVQFEDAFARYLGPKPG